MNIPSTPNGGSERIERQLQAELDALTQLDRFRSTQPYGGPDRSHPADAGGTPLVSFCSNDYLGLASHSDLVAALRRAAAEGGVGAGAARLVSGESPAHTALETALAAFVGRPAAVLFPTGYLTNLGVLTALAGPDDLVVSDAANHASIIDGCRLSRARVMVYPHLDSDAASAALGEAGPYRRRILVTESLFSMDGDRAPLAALAAAAHRVGALLIVDEAHALGASGPGGRGLAALAGVVPDVLIGTLGKAFGTHGGFAAGSATLRSYLVNRARPFIYSTASPPPIAAATLAAVTLLSGPEGQARRAKAHAVASRLRQAVARLGPAIPGEDLILPFRLDDDRAALEAAGYLRRQGFLVPAIRPPTVPSGTARLRITVTALHTPEDADALVAALMAYRRGAR